MFDCEERYEQGVALSAAWNRAMGASKDRSRFVQDYVKVLLNAPGCISLDYNIDDVLAWYAEVVPVVRAMLVRDYGVQAPNAVAFNGCGSIGSVWCDVPLTGCGKTKKTRLCLGRVGTVQNIKSFTVMLDPTFEEEW